MTLWPHIPIKYFNSDLCVCVFFNIYYSTLWLINVTVAKQMISNFLDFVLDDANFELSVFVMVILKFLGIKVILS